MRMFPFPSSTHHEYGMWNQIIVSSNNTSNIANLRPFSLSFANRKECRHLVLCAESPNGHAHRPFRQTSYRLASTGTNCKEQCPAWMAWMLSIQECRCSRPLYDGIAWVGIWYHSSHHVSFTDSLSLTQWNPVPFIICFCHNSLA